MRPFRCHLRSSSRVASLLLAHFTTPRGRTVVALAASALLATAVVVPALRAADPYDATLEKRVQALERELNLMSGDAKGKNTQTYEVPTFLRAAGKQVQELSRRSSCAKCGSVFARSVHPESLSKPEILPTPTVLLLDVLKAELGARLAPGVETFLDLFAADAVPECPFAPPVSLTPGTQVHGGAEELPTTSRWCPSERHASAPAAPGDDLIRAPLVVDGEGPRASWSRPHLL